jgi:hypothetical protein
MCNASRLIETNGSEGVWQCLFTANFLRSVYCSVRDCIGVCTLMRVVEVI